MLTSQDLLQELTDRDLAVPARHPQAGEYDVDGLMWGSERQGPLGNVLVANHAEHPPPSGEVTALGEGDQPLGEGAQPLRLCLRGPNPVVLEQ